MNKKIVHRNQKRLKILERRGKCGELLQQYFTWTVEFAQFVNENIEF